MSTYANMPFLFTPKNIAVLGASTKPEKIGHLVVSNLLESHFPGKIFPINPKGGSILGLPVLSKIVDISKEHLPLDLAILVLPAKNICEELEILGNLGTKSAIIISAGFKETGIKGTKLELTLKGIAKKHQMAILGPNSFGLLNTSAQLNATFAKGALPPGNIGFFSQSGALCAAMFDWAKGKNIGFSSFISLGNKMNIDESDVLVYLANDPATKVIVGYLESIENGARFLHNAHVATRKKPVILLKAGRTAAGARAASSHTGALAGQDMAIEAAFKQTGIIRANTIEEIFSKARAFATQPLPKGPGIAIVTNAGGPAILAADASEFAGLSIASFSQNTIAQLQKLLPPYASLFNPVDVISETSPATYAETIKIVLEDASVHMLLVLLVPTSHNTITEMAKNLAPLLASSTKTVFACLMGGDSVQEGHTIFTSMGVPCFLFPENAVKALATMYRQSLWKDNPLPVEVNYRRDISRAKKEISLAREAGSLELVEFQAQGLLKAYEMPMLESKLARTSDEACQIAKQLGFPVALKIASPQIAHKTDVKGLILNLKNTEAVRAAFLSITTRISKIRKDAYIAGCLVQSMATENSREIIIGFKRDKRFGPMVIFGLGGIHVEAFKDISCRLAPLSLDDVHDMVCEIKAYPILAGMRGQLPVKFTALEDILLIMSQMALDFPEIEEAECNPVFADEKGAYVADIKVILTPEKNRP